MAKDETKRMRPSDLQADRDTLAAIKAMSGYAPANSAYTAANLTAKLTGMVDAKDIEVQKQAEADSARDDAVAAEWAFHNAVLGAKDQVKAQYGDDSNEYQAVGRTKASERHSPGARSPVPAPKP